MREGKLITVLKTFDTKQFKRLLEFAASPYFNKNTEIVAFLSVLFKIYPQWDESKLEDAYLYKKTFLDSPFDKKRLYYLRSYTTDLIEQFIVHEAIAKNEFEYSHKLLLFYQANNINEYFEQTYKQMQVLLQKTEINDGNANYQQFLLVWEWFQYQMRSKERVGNLNLTKTHHYLDIFYFINKLSLHISDFSMKSVVQVCENQGIDLENIVTLWKENPHLAQHPTLQLLHSYLNMLRYPETEESQNKAWESLNTDKKQLPVEAVNGLYTILRNFYISQINKGDEAASQKLFEIYDNQLNEGIILDEQQAISSASFKNIATLGLKLKHFEWVKQFIEKYGAHLSGTDNRVENILHFVWAKYYFEIADYPKVLKYLHQITEYAYPVLDIQARKLLIQTYYELKESENVLVQLNSFRVYLSRNQIITEDKKQAYQFFASAMNKLALTDFSSKSKTNNSYVFIQRMNEFAEKGWFLAKFLK